MKKIRVTIFLLFLTGVLNAQPISLLSSNPHYYFYKNKPTVLITSAEHYGAIVNKGFNYHKYLDWLASHDLNYTRIYPGYLTEPPGKWIKGNTLAPEPDDIILPWKRSNESGYALGGNKFDLDQWNPEYFKRLDDFISYAEKKGIVVEICFFNAQYEDCWPICPLYYKNNIQGTGNCPFNDAQTLKHPDLVKYESDYVARIVKEVNSFDNVILELCDEPTINGTPIAEAGQWLDHMIETVVQTEKDLPKKHLVAQQIEGPLNGPCDFSADPRISVITCQYDYEAYGRQLGGLNGLKFKYSYNKPVELNETYYYPVWYKGDSIADSRVEAWEFIVGGGGSFNHLNGRYTDADPSGNTPDNEAICGTLKALVKFINSVDFRKMKPDTGFIEAGVPPNTFYKAMSWPGNQYILYIHGGKCTEDSSAYTVYPSQYQATLTLQLTRGKFEADWIRPADGKILKTEHLDNDSGVFTVASPVFSEDIALRIVKFRVSLPK